MEKLTYINNKINYYLIEETEDFFICFDEDMKLIRKFVKFKKGFHKTEKKEFLNYKDFKLIE